MIVAIRLKEKKPRAHGTALAESCLVFSTQGLHSGWEELWFPTAPLLRVVWRCTEQESGGSDSAGGEKKWSGPGRKSE